MEVQENRNRKDKICLEKVQGCFLHFMQERHITENQGNPIQKLCAKHSELWL